MRAGLHEAYTLLVLPVPVSRVHLELFNHIHVITHLPENAWLLLDPKLSFLHEKARQRPTRTKS